MLSEMLAVIESMDPTTIPLWLTTAAAAAMYPMGLMLGSSCSPCCTECGCPPNEVLPETLTVTFSNFSDEKTPTIWLCNLRFSSDFYIASGGKAHATTPDACGTPDSPPSECWGPIGDIVIDEPGSNYAKIGHRHPNVVTLQPSVSPFSGSVATATPTWQQFKNGDNFNLPAWRVANPIAITTAGSGYEYGTQVTLEAAGNGTQSFASGWTKVAQSPPTLTVTGNGGEGLEAAISVREKVFTSIYDGMRGWEFDKSTITNGGSGYSDGDYVTITLGEGDVVVIGASLVVRTVRAEPTARIQLQAASGGGAQFAITFTQVNAPYPIPAFYSPLWRITAVTVISGGSGYTPGTHGIDVLLDDGQPEYFSFPATGTAVVDSTGAVTSVTVDQPTVYPFSNYFFKDTGVVDRIEVAPFGGGRGLYYKTDGAVTAVVVPAAPAGTYFVEDASVPALVADVSVTVSQYPPSDGSGAEFAVTVDSDPASPTFGQITGVTVTNGGDQYLARWWSNSKCCGSFYNGKSYVVKRSHLIEPFGDEAGSPYPYVYPYAYFPDDKCVYAHNFCGTHYTDPMGHAHWSSVIVEYPGENNHPVVRVTRDAGCAIEMRSTTQVGCNGLEFTAVADPDDEQSPTAEVSPSGEFDPFDGFPTTQNNSCHPCCQATTVPVERYMITIIDTETGLPILLGYRNLNPYLYLSEAVEHLVIGQDGAGSWGGSLSFPSSGSATVTGWTPQYYGVRIHPCATQSSSGGWVPRDAGSGSYPSGEDYCDECWKQCEQQFYMPGVYGGGWLYTKQCDGCTSSPRCNLTTGEYPLFSDYDTGPNGFFVPGLGGGWLPGPNQIGEFPPFATKYKLVLEAAE